MQRLENSRWGFESNCFVCEDRNPAGLRLPFFHDEERNQVVASLELDERFSGAPQYLHGGIALAVLDEAMAWATIAIAGCFAVTKETNARFHRPLRVKTPYEVRARVLDDTGDLRCEAEIVDAKGQQRVTASAVFTALGSAQAVDAIGSAPQGDDARYIRPAESSGEAADS